MIAITGAAGQLGRLVLAALQAAQKSGALAPTPLVAVVRHPEKAADLAAQGITVRQGDYDQPATLASALQGVQKLLLISSSEVGKRAPQHSNVIAAAEAAQVGLVAYTSVLHAPDSPLGLAAEHRQTEARLAASGLPHVILRNGWYTENYLAGLPAALAHGVLLGAAGSGRIASAPRADYAEAAARVLTLPGQAGKVYELAGDEAYTLADLAAEVSRCTGRTIPYQDLPEAEYRRILIQAGLPEGLAALLADSDAGAARGALDDHSGQLHQLLGRPTASWRALVRAAIGA